MNAETSSTEVPAGPSRRGTTVFRKFVGIFSLIGLLAVLAAWVVTGGNITPVRLSDVPQVEWDHSRSEGISWEVVWPAGSARRSPVYLAWIVSRDAPGAKFSETPSYLVFQTRVRARDAAHTFPNRLLADGADREGWVRTAASGRPVDCGGGPMVSVSQFSVCLGQLDVRDGENVLIGVELLGGQEWLEGRKSTFWIWGDNDGDLLESESVGQAIGTLLFGCSTLVFGSVLLVTWVAIRRARSLAANAEPARATSE